jgi:hypothetical protein
VTVVARIDCHDRRRQFDGAITGRMEPGGWR